MDNFFSTLAPKRNSLYLLWGILFVVIAVATCKETLADSQLKGEENKSKFGFRIELFSKCSKPCGGGTQIGIYVCYNKTSTLAVQPSHCGHLNPPGRYLRVCNMRPCAYRWHTGTWSPCSTSCGEGTKQRHIKCIDRHEVRVLAWRCARIKIPQRKHKCGIADCNPEFHVGPWSKCSSTCGEGRKNRTVLCKQSLANGTIITLPHSSCEGMVPAKAVKCKATKCSQESLGGGSDIQGEEPLDQEAGYDASDASAAGSGDGGGGEEKVGGKDPPIIKVSTQPKYILKQKGSLSVLVGTKVWAVRDSEITVSCTATGKFPAKITWTRDDYEITTYFEDDVGIVNGNLKIRGTDRFNEGTYVCEAKSEGGTATAIFTLAILVPNKPNIFADDSSLSFGPDKEKVEVTVGGKVTLFTGSMLTIKCPVIGKPPPRVWWLSKGKPISVGKAKMIGNDLVIDKIDKIFSLDYTCNARNFRGSASAKTSVIVLDLSPPKIEAQIKMIDKPISSRRVTTVIGTNLTLISGASLMIRCPVSSKPVPFVSWMAKGRPITGRVNRIMISRDKSSMIVSKMVIADTGVYSCMAKNVAGKDTKSSYVKIVAPQLPTIQSKSGFRSTLEKDQEMTVTIGEQATALAGIMLKIICPAKGLPSPAISWQINRRAVTRFTRQYVAQGNTLVIKKLSRDENGNIACTARNPIGSATGSSKVNVIDGLKPQIKFKTGRVVGDGSKEEESITIGQDLRIIQGLIFRLRCRVTGFPRPTVTWSVNDNDVVSSQRILIDKDNNDLIINGIDKSDVGQYVCLAINPLGQATKSSFVSIIDEKSASIEVGKAKLDTTKSKAPVTIRIGDSLNALSGTDVTILCPVKGVPSPDVQWRRNGKKFKPEDFKGQFRNFQMNTVLKILQVSPEVAGEYECIAKNVGGFDRVPSTITVVASQSPSINFGSARQESIEDISRVQATIGSLVRMLAGSMLSLACPSSGVPRPTFSWDYNGKPIKSQGRFQLIGNSLVINQTMASDTGRYRCTATNIVASDKRHSDVTVLAPIKPQIQGNPKDQEVLAAIPVSTEVGSTIKSIEGASLQLTCTAKGLPTPKIQWKFEEIVVSGNILKLPNLDPGDSKNYTCEASNLGGVDRRVTSLFVRALEKPVILSSEGSLTSFKRNQKIAANIGKSITILKGTVLGLLCHVVGFPPPSVAWTKDTITLRPGRGFSPFRQNLTHYGMAINTRFNTDFSGKYECVASNVGGSVAASSVVVVKAPTKPVVKSTRIVGSIGWTKSLDNRDPRVITIGDNAEVLTGTEVTINCLVSGLPAPSVAWFVGRRRLTSGGRYTIPRSNVLIIGNKRYPSTVANSLEYRCVAANYLGSDNAVSKLRFTAPRPPKILTVPGQFEYIIKRNITMTIGAKIIAIIDSNITLQCQADGLPLPKITWLHNGVLQRQNGRQFVISKASKIDTGTYQCTASNLAGTRSASSVVTVQDQRPKTEKPKIFPSNQNIIASENKVSFNAVIGSNITILEGKNLVLQCPTTGLPTPKVTWYFNNKAVVTSETLIVNPKTGELTVIEMMKEEAGVYTCESKNIAGQDRAFTFAIVVGPKAPKISASSNIYVKLDPTRKPIKINIGDSLTTFKGTRVAIECLSTGFPNPRIRWNRNDISLAPQIPVFINGSMIILTNPEVSDTGKYTCLASNPGGNIEASSNVTFLAPQSPNITTTPGDVEFLKRGPVTIRIGSNLRVLEGNSIAIKCEATGIPTPTLSWRRNQNILRITSNVLRARNIRRADSGRITCEARNYFGRDSKTTVITVIAGQKPKIKTSTKAISDVDNISKHSAVVRTSFKVLAGSRIRLSCSATGIPKPVYSWSLNKRPVVNSDRIYFNQSTGVLDIKSVIPGDSGQAQCTATNIIGTDRSESSLNIIALRGPFIQSSKLSIKPLNSVKPIRIRIGTNVNALVNTTINIVCQVAGLPVPVTSWSYNDKVLRRGRLIVKGTTLTIPKAQMDDEGVYACTASSAAGNLTVKSQILLNAGQRPSITSSDDVIAEHSDFSTTSATIGSSVSILTGAGVRFTCSVNGLPQPAVWWKIDGRNAIPGPSVVIDFAKNTLTITKLRRGSAKRTVSCTALNPLGVVSASSDVTVIDPILPRINSSKTAIVQLTKQNPVVSLVGNKITILEGTSVSLVCEATGLPEPEVRWTLANIPVTSDGHVTIDGGVVKFTKVGRGDAGTYSCKTTSLVGMDTASTVIDVKEIRGPFIDSSTKVLSLISSIKPIEIKIGSNLTALSTTNITIDCSADGFPVPVTSWRKDGKIIIKDHVTVRGSKLIITRARFADGGVYECNAKSVAGERKVKSHLTVIAGQKPIISSSDEVESTLTGFTKLTSTIGSSISILARSGIRILCPVRGIPRPVVTWKIKRKSDKNRIIFDRNHNFVTIPILVSGDSGEFTCIAKNILGETRASSALNVIEPFKPRIDKSHQRINVLDSQAPVTIRVGATARVLAGVSITINCKAVGLPYPNIFWNLRGKPLKTQGHVTVDDSKLVILNAGSEDSGMYGCVALSAMGNDTAETRLTIHSGEKARITTVGRQVSSLDGFVNITSYVGDNITSLTGSDLTIYCPTEGIPEPVVSWSRGGAPLRSDRRYTVNPFTNALRIRKLRREDSGGFTCSARNNRGGDQKTSFLNVIVPYVPTIIKSSKSIDGLKSLTPISIIIGDSLTALVNATITIQCKANGLPQPKTSWSRNGVKIVSGGHVSIGKETIKIQKARLDDQGVYKCTASSDAGTVSASSVVVIKVPIPPTIKTSNKTIVSLTRKPLGIIIGETVRTLTRINFNITCEVEGLPKPEIIWRKNGVELPIDGRTYANGPIIYVADALTADTGFYVCEAKNVAGKKTVVSKLNIREPSIPEISATGQRKLQRLRPVSITTEVGSYIKTLETSNITLSCDAKGFPEPTITWKKGVKNLDVARGNKTFTITKATTSDSGIYTCTAANLKGYDFRSSNVTIVAPKAPTIKTSTKPLTILRREPVESDVGGSLTTLSENTIKLLCNASGVPKPTLEWYKNNIKINNKARVLTFSPASPRDTGIYSCVARNLAGMVKVDTDVNILEGKVPSIVTSKKTISELTRIQYIVTKVGGVVNTLFSSNVEIMCEASGFPKPEVTWYKDGEEIPKNSATHMVDSKTGTLMFVSLALRKAGIYKCVAKNSLGTASASTVLNVKGLKHPYINSSRGVVTSLKSRKPSMIFIGHNLTVLSGSNISITCPSGGVPLPEVTWKRGKALLASGGRVNVSPKVLSINKVVKSDSGRYTCSVENVMGKISIGSNINVLDPVLPNILYKFSIIKVTESEPISTIVGTRVTSIPGNRLTLTCNVSGLPTPSITWMRNNLLAQKGGSTYTVPSLKVSDSGSYTCVATNLAGEAKETSNVFVIAGSKPEIVTPKTNIIATEGENEVPVDVGGNITTIVGTGVEIRCTVTGKPTPSITWLQNGSVVEATSVRFINRLTKALTLLGVSQDDSGFYTCFANNTFGQVSETTHLTIFAAERPSIRFSKRKIEDYEKSDFKITIGDTLKTLIGTTITIQCNATGNPPPEIQWFKSGTPIISNFAIKASNNTLKIHGAMWSDTGEYECLATNAAGSDKKTSFVNFVPPEKPVIFQDPSVIEVYNRTPVAMTIGNTLKTLTQTPISISCAASGIPMPTYSWTKKGNPIVSSSDLEISLGGKQLTVRNLVLDDAGIYGCKAKNKAGTDAGFAPILVLEPILPRIESTDENITWYDRIPLSAPIGGKITALTGTQVTLTCNAIGFPEPTVVWRRDDEVDILVTDGQYKLENRSLVIFAVQPGDSGSYKCFAENLAGTVKSSTELNVIDPQEPVIMTSNKIVRTEDRTPVVATIGNRIFVIAGTPVSITCNVQGIPKPSVSWSNGGRFLYPTNNNSALVFANTTVANSGEYTCTAISPIGGDAASSVLSVAVPVKPRIVAPPIGRTIQLANKTQRSITIRDSITVLYGTVLDIECSAIGLPKPKIFWIKENRRIKSVNGTLKVRINGKSDAGRFTCVAMNSEGDDSATSTVMAVEPLYPRIQSRQAFISALEQPRTTNSTVGTTIKTLSSTTVILQCPATGNPDPFIQWSKSGQLIVSGDRVTLTERGDLVIQKSHVLDSGEYKCLARNILGQDTAVSTVIILNPTRPEITRSTDYIIWYENRPFKSKIGNNLTTMKGRKLTLVCPAKGRPRPEITWYRGGERMRNEYNYVIEGNTLVIWDLSVFDTDRYTCVAENYAGSDAATSTVKVHEPVEPHIFKARGFINALSGYTPINITAGQDVKAPANSLVVLTCPIKGVPRPKIIWLKDQEPVLSDNTIEVDCNGTMKFHAIRLSDAGEYICYVESFLGMDLALTHVEVVERSIPIIHKSNNVIPIIDNGGAKGTIGDNVTALLTQTIVINCNATGIPYPVITWTRNGLKIESVGLYSIDKKGTLTITGVARDGVYKCSAKNNKGTDTATSYVTVKEPKGAQIISPRKPKTIPFTHNKNVTINIRDNVTTLPNATLTIKCEAVGVPEPSVTWSKDGSAIPLEYKYRVLGNGALVVENVVESDSGRYTCKAENTRGVDTAMSLVNISKPTEPVIDRPIEPRNVQPTNDGHVTVSIGENVTAVIGSKVLIDCIADGDPKPSVTWTKDNVELKADDGYTVYKNGTLEIPSASTKDKGKYVCTAKSAGGEDSEGTNVMVVEQSKPLISRPDKPRTIPPQDKSPVNATIGDNVTVLTNSDLIIDCPSTGVPQPMYSWSKDGEKLTSGAKYSLLSNGTLVMKKVSVDEKGTYTCTMENIAGSNNGTTTVDVVEPEKPKITEPRKPTTKIPRDRSPVTMTIGDNVTALDNTSISIDCPTSGIPKPMITWTKDEEELSSGNSYVVYDNGTLWIKMASLKDKGRYTCLARNRNGVDNKTSVVDVVTPNKPKITRPKEPQTIIPKDRSPINMTVGDNVTALTNTPISIDCPASGIPKPKISWRKDGQEVITGGGYLIHENGTLVIEKASAEDRGRYMCVLENLNGKVNSSTDVKVVDEEKPQITRPHKPRTISPHGKGPVNATIGDNVTILTNTDLTIDCPSTGSPRPTYSWSKDGEKIKLGINFFLLPNGTLIIKKVSMDESGTYKCTVENIAGNASEKTQVLAVAPKKPRISKPKEPQTYPPKDRKLVNIAVGNNVTSLLNTPIKIVCSATGSPKPRITWMKNGKALDQSDDRYSVFENGTLFIVQASQEDQGKYTCIAKNKEGQDNASSTVEITSPKKPKITRPKEPKTIIPKDRSPINMTVGDNVTALTNTPISIDCPTSGIPKPKISWRKDGQEVISGGEYVIHENGTLVIEKASAEDRGRYTCVAKNVDGEESISSTINVTDSAKPKIGTKDKLRDVHPSDRRPVNITVGDNITALTNTDISINCPATGTPRPTTTWLKDGQSVREGGRVVIHDNGKLVIKNASPEERGRYTCKVKNIDGEDTKTSTVDVVGPKKPKITRPKEPQTITPKDRSPINMTVGDNVTALTNTPISIDCPTSGIPKPKISWRKDGQEVISGVGYLIHENGTLVIEKASAEDRGRYTCVAKNVDGEESISSTINVTDSAKPKIGTKDKPRDVHPSDRLPVNITVGDNITALTNTDISIHCPATGTPRPTTTWLKDGQSVREGGRVVIHNNGTLVIRNASPEERGRYTCKVKNIDGEDNKTSTVDVVGPKKPKITRPKEPKTITPKDRSPINMTVGDNVTALTNTPISIDCPTSGIPKPKISWRKDGQEVISGGGYVIHENGTLVIEKASAEDRGRYTCVAKNVDGEESISSTINVTDSAKPKIGTKDKPRDVHPSDRRPVNITVGDNITALTNTDISIGCPVTGTPRPTTTWLKDGQSLREGGRVVIHDNGTLVIRNASPKERGRYTCKVKNIDGEDKKTSTVNVVGPKKPKITRPKDPKTIIPKDRSPINMTVGDNVTALTNTPISIDCPTSGIPKPKISWRKDGQEVISGGEYVIHENGTLVIEKASAEDRGRYTCVAKNVDGEESISSTINVTDSTKPKIGTKDKPRDVHPSDRRPVNITVGDNITALTNTDISIDCPATGTPRPTTTWLKDGQSLREGGRVVILDNGTLVIKNASPEERGRYTCKVKNIDGEDKKTSTVDVVGPKKPKITRPKEPKTIIPKDRSPINMTVGDNVTALTNTPISIDCPTSGIPKPKISWRKDGQEVIPGGEYVIHENGTLVIEKASAEDRGRYTCVAKNVDGEESISSTINVTDSAKPKIGTKDKPRDVHPPDRRPVNITVGDNITALTNTDISINCPVTGTPRPTTTWLKDGQSLREGGRVVILDNGTLIIKNASPEERGRYTCKVKNIDGEDKKTSTVNVVDSDAARIRRPKNPRNVTSEDETPVSVDVGNNIIAISNSRISINCPVTGTPKPLITWRLNGFELVKRVGYIVLDNGTLVIEKAKAKDKGQYTCLATNIAGKDSVTTNVKVLKPTSPTIDRPDKPRSVSPGDGSPVNITIGDNVTALTGTPITIDCLATGVPSPQVIWTKDGRELRSGSGYVIYENGTLLIIQASREERGRYKCTVKNKNGEDSTTSTIDTVDPVKPKITRPDKPKSILPKDRSPINMTVGDNVTALTNTPISIDCPTSGIPKPKISWRKDGQPITTGDTFVVHENGTLFIKKARKGDKGKYTCTSLSSNGEDSKSSNVAVVDSNKPSINETGSKNIPVGDGGPKTIKTGDNVTTIPDAPIKITCNADGIPRPTVTWYKDGREIGPEDNARVLPNNTLLLLAVTSQQGGVYTCKARNIDGEDTSSSKVTVVTPRKPFIVVPKVSRNIRVGKEPSKKVTISDNVRTTPGKKISITCQALGLPKPKITWSRNGVVIRTGGEYEIDKNNTLTLRDVKLSHSGTYTCTARNVAGEDRASSKLTVVTFSEPEIQKPTSNQNIESKRIGPVVMTIGDNITAFSGSTIKITCIASGIPKPLITWLKDGRAVIPGEKKIIDQKGSLTLRGVVSQDSGRYTCVAMNFAGRDTEDSFVTILTPQSPSIPVAQIKQEIDVDAPISVDVGADVTALAETTISINCKASGFPEPTTTWSKDGQLIKSGELYEVLKNKTLVIRQAQDYDSGIYVCTAKNIFGEDKKSSRVEVIEAEVPVIQRTKGDFESSDMKPVVVDVGRHVTSLSRVNINVKCTARGLPPPRIEWMNGGKMLDVKGPMLSLKNVSVADSGIYTCIASNVAGRANASTFVNITEPVSPVIHKASSKLVLNTIKSTSSLIGESIEMLTGSSLLLICNATGHPRPKIKWTKSGLPLVSRDRYVINGMALRIFGVRPTDSSEIACTATNIVGEAVETSELLVKGLLIPTINAVKKEIKNFDKTKPIRVPIGAKLITTLNTTVVVRCSVTSRPRAALSWQRNGQPLVTNDKYKLNGDKSELTITDVQFSDDGVYVCTAFNRAGTDFASMDLIVAIPPVISNVRGSFEVTDIRDLISITTGAVVTIPKGVSIKIKCDATGVPTPNITWYRVAEGSKNWEPIGKSNERLHVDKDSFLSIQRSKEVDIAQYVCVATNVAGRDEGVTYLNVGAVPDIPGYWAAARKFTRPSVKRIETMATVIRGSTLRLRCTVYGSPKPEVTWNVVGNENRDRWKIFPDGTLQIVKVDFSDEGNYTCVGKNGYGTTYRSTNVTVLVPPKILDKFFSEAYLKSKARLMYVKYSSITKLAIKGEQKTRAAAVEKGGNLIIGCPVRGRPDPTILWLRNGLKVKNDSKHLVLDGVLMIRNISDAETGEYFCFVRNTAGEDGGGLELHVRDKIIGSWKISRWSECQYCYGNFRGYANRTVDCMDDRNNTVPESYCSAVPAPPTRQMCRTRSCEAIWTKTSWSECSALCGGNGVKKRTVKCVFYKSLLPADGLCNPTEKPISSEPCNRAPCGKRICKDKVNYCKQIKGRNLCTAYRAWCCETCGGW